MIASKNRRDSGILDLTDVYAYSALKKATEKLYKKPTLVPYP